MQGSEDHVLSIASLNLQQCWKGVGNVCGRLEGEMLHVLLLGSQSHRVWECGQAVCQKHFGPQPAAICLCTGECKYQFIKVDTA